jgi:hypothetical protein
MGSVLIFIDGYLIHLYRITGNPLLDYFMGTFLLALISALAGEATVTLLGRVNRSHMERLDRELAEKHGLSMEAKLSGDEGGYRRLNREANDAFGRVFFNMFTFSAASLWAVFIALAWMQTRFMRIEFPLPFSIPLMGESAGHVFIFLLLYITARILTGNLKRLLALDRRSAVSRNQDPASLQV